MDIQNTTFVEYNSKEQLKDIFSFIEYYEVDDFLDINIKNVIIKCIKLIIKLWSNSNEGHELKYLIIFKIY